MDRKWVACVIAGVVVAASFGVFYWVGVGPTDSGADVDAVQESGADDTPSDVGGKPGPTTTPSTDPAEKEEEKPAPGPAEEKQETEPPADEGAPDEPGPPAFTDMVHHLRADSCEALSITAATPEGSVTECSATGTGSGSHEFLGAPNEADIPAGTTIQGTLYVELTLNPYYTTGDLTLKVYLGTNEDDPDKEHIGGRTLTEIAGTGIQAVPFTVSIQEPIPAGEDFFLTLTNYSGTLSSTIHFDAADHDTVITWTAPN